MSQALSEKQVGFWTRRVSESIRYGRVGRTAAKLAALHIKHKGRVFPSQEQLAEWLGLSVRTVRDHLARMEAAGFLVVNRCEPSRDPATGAWCRRYANRYVLAFPQATPRGKCSPVKPRWGVRKVGARTGGAPRPPARPGRFFFQDPVLVMPQCRVVGFVGPSAPPPEERPLAAAAFRAIRAALHRS